MAFNVSNSLIGISQDGKTIKLWLTIEVDDSEPNISVTSNHTDSIELSLTNADEFVDNNYIYKNRLFILENNTSMYDSEQAYTITYNDEQQRITGKSQHILDVQTKSTQSKNYDKEDPSHVSTLITEPLEPARYNLKATFLENDKWESSSTQIRYIVTPLLKITTEYIEGQGIYVRVRTTNEDLPSTPHKVDYYIDDQSSGTITLDSSNNYTFLVRLNYSELNNTENMFHTVKFLSSDSASAHNNYATKEALVSFTTPHQTELTCLNDEFDTNTYYHNDLVKATFQLKDKSLSKILQGQTIMIEGKEYITDESGLVFYSESCDILPDISNNTPKTITATFNETEEYTSSTYTTKGYKCSRFDTTITPLTTLTAASPNTITVSETFLDSTQQPLINKTIAFKLNGATIASTTNDQGIGTVEFEGTKLTGIEYDIEVVIGNTDYTNSLRVHRPLIYKQPQKGTLTISTPANPIIGNTGTATLTLNEAVKVNTPYVITFNDKTIAQGTLNEGSSQLNYSSKLFSDDAGTFNYTITLKETEYNLSTTFKQSIKLNEPEEIVVGNIIGSYDDSYVLTAKVPSTVTSIIKFFELKNGEEYGIGTGNPEGGVAKYTVPAGKLSEGKHEYYARTSSDPIYGTTPSESAYITVYRDPKINVKATATQTVVDPTKLNSSKQYTTPLIVTVTSVANNVKGTLTLGWENYNILQTSMTGGITKTIYLDSTKMVQGGIYNIYAKFEADDNTYFKDVINYKTSYSVKVLKIPKLTYNAVAYTDPAPWNIMCAPEKGLTGNILYTMDGITIARTLMVGVTVDLSKYSGIKKTVTALYSGDSNYTSATSNISTYVRSTPVVGISIPTSISTGQTVAIGANVTNNGTKISTPTTISVNGTTIYSGTGGGTYTKNYTFSKAGTYTITVLSGWTTLYKGVSTTKTVTVKDKVVVIPQILTAGALIIGCNDAATASTVYNKCKTPADGAQRKDILVYMSDTYWTQTVTGLKALIALKNSTYSPNVYAVIPCYNMSKIRDEIDEIYDLEYSIDNSARKTTLISRIKSVAALAGLTGIIFAGMRPGFGADGTSQLESHMSTLHTDFVAATKSVNSALKIGAYVLSPYKTLTQGVQKQGLNISTLDNLYDFILLNPATAKNYTSTTSLTNTGYSSISELRNAYATRVKNVLGLVKGELDGLADVTASDSIISLSKQREPYNNSGIVYMNSKIYGGL